MKCTCGIDIMEHPAGECIDRLVAKKIFKNRFGFVNKYSSDIKPAWDVVLYFMNHGFCPNLINDDDGHWALSFEGTSLVGGKVPAQTAFVEDENMWCDEAPLAIVRSSLMAYQTYIEDYNRR